MSILSDAPVAEATNARDYFRAHSGKLMIIARNDDRERSASDFFYLDSVGTHPTGLLVTGTFENDRRSHMRAELVRDANEEEIAWRNNSQN
ncbi:MAG: hypothetical protein ACJ8KX_07515 [Chthoniobacterales bacterium]